MRMYGSFGITPSPSACTPVRCNGNLCASGGPGGAQPPAFHFTCMYWLENINDIIGIVDVLGRICFLLFYCLMRMYDIFGITPSDPACATVWCNAAFHFM